MRVIIIEDKDAKALMNELSLTAMDHSLGCVDQIMQDAWQSLPTGLRKEIVEKVHGKFVYRVVGWLQAQGANFL